jgi:hypothetical protein
VAPALLVLPVGHAAQVAEPAAALYVLAAQIVHASEAPEPELEKPAAQVQVAASALLVLLLGHAEQLLAMAAL